MYGGRVSAGAEQLSLLVVGAGRWGKNWLRVCSSLRGARLTAVCDEDPLRLAAASVGDGVARFESVDEALRERSIDAVVVATPAATHARLALAALQANKFVLVEKPLATSVRDAERVAAASSGRVMAGHLLCYHPGVLALRALIQKGELGAVTHVVCERPGAPAIPGEDSAWWAFAPHDISVMRWLFDAEPQVVQALSHARADQSPEDFMTAILSFDGGRLGVVRVGGPPNGNMRRITVVGERRSVTLSDQAGQVRLAHYESGPQGALEGRAPVFSLGPIREEQVQGEEPLRAQGQHFVDSALGGTSFRSGAHDGLAVVKALTLGSEAVRQDRKVRLRYPAEKLI